MFEGRLSSNRPFFLNHLNQINMGYTTDFTGHFTTDAPMKQEHARYLRAFNRTRRMRRDAEIASKLPDPIRLAVGLPIGNQGEYFVNGAGFMGQDRDESVLDTNAPPRSQPGLWCQWAPCTEFGDLIEEGMYDQAQGLTWDQGEKFYYYTDWLHYLVKHFIKPWGYVLNGEVEWAGEDYDDRGKIQVNNNEITTFKGRLIYG